MKIRVIRWPLLLVLLLCCAHRAVAQPHYSIVEPPKAKGDIKTLAFTSATHGVVVLTESADSVNVHLTRNGGKTWTPVTATPSRYSHVVFVDALLGFIVDNSRQHAKMTVDGGETWTTLKGYEFGAMSAPSESVIYAVESRYLSLYHSTDRGQSWTRLELPPTDTASSYSEGRQVAFRDSLHGFVAGVEGNGCGHEMRHVYYTSDGGVTWEEPFGDNVGSGYLEATPVYLGKSAWLVGGYIFIESTQTEKGYIFQDLTIQAGKDRALGVRYDTSWWSGSRIDTLYEILEGGKLDELMLIPNLAGLYSFNENVSALLSSKTRNQDSTTRILVTTTGWRGIAAVKREETHSRIRVEGFNVYSLPELEGKGPLSLFDPTGREILFSEPQGLLIDLSPYPSGIYFLKAGGTLFKLVRIPN